MQDVHFRDQDAFYGKADVSVYRTYARPLEVAAVPESSFTGRTNVLFAVNVEVLAAGDDFLAAYTDGDNSSIVATDSMKNFILRHAAQYLGATLEGFLAFVGRRFLETYPQMAQLQISGREVPFAHGGGDLVYRRAYGETGIASFDLTRAADGSVVVSTHSCGLADLHLVKITGNAFVGFVRDEFTTLPEMTDRPLFTWMNINWSYMDPADAQGDNPDRYVHAEQVRDVAQAVFLALDTLSIQQLIHRIGQRLLERFPALADVRMEAQNRTWEAVVPGEGQIRVYTDPRPPIGVIGLRVSREEA